MYFVIGNGIPSPRTGPQTNITNVRKTIWLMVHPNGHFSGYNNLTKIPCVTSSTIPIKCIKQQRRKVTRANN